MYTEYPIQYFLLPSFQSIDQMPSVKTIRSSCYSVNIVINPINNVKHYEDKFIIQIPKLCWWIVCMYTISQLHCIGSHVNL